MTGSLFRIDIRAAAACRCARRGTAGRAPISAWRSTASRTCSPSPGRAARRCSPTLMPSIEQHVEWVTDCIEALRDRGAAVIEAERAAQDDWVGHVNDLANALCARPARPGISAPTFRQAAGLHALYRRLPRLRRQVRRRGRGRLRGVCDQVTTASAARRLSFPASGFLRKTRTPGKAAAGTARRRMGGGRGIRHVMKCHGSDAEHSLEPRRSDTLTITY